VRDGKIPDRIFIEGLRLCEEALRAGVSIEMVLHTSRFASEERGARLLRELSARGAQIKSVGEQVFDSIAHTKSPQGVVIIGARPQTSRRAFERRVGQIPLLVIMHRINNPANCGSILRTAEAAGADGAIITKGAADLFSPKALRGAMGSSFRVPIWTGVSYSQALGWCAEQNIQTICADPRAHKNYTDVDWKKPSALIVGPESSGLESEELAGGDQGIRIPMSAPVESLNVSVAAGIALYEARRQREALAGSDEILI
jgi:RNA methyltransferase, TrmH family